jgi:osmotically-inducible protein OsmY
MKRINQRYALPMTLFLSGAFTGCATHPACDAPGCKDDAAISAEVRSLLKERAALDASSVDVQTWNHVVYLYGIVDTEYQWQEAQAVAMDATDAVRVVNLLGVNNR